MDNNWYHTRILSCDDDQPEVNDEKSNAIRLVFINHSRRPPDPNPLHIRIVDLKHHIHRMRVNMNAAIIAAGVSFLAHFLFCKISVAKSWIASIVSMILCGASSTLALVAVFYWVDKVTEHIHPSETASEMISDCKTYGFSFHWVVVGAICAVIQFFLIVATCCFVQVEGAKKYKGLLY